MTLLLVSPFVVGAAAAVPVKPLVARRSDFATCPARTSLKGVSCMAGGSVGNAVESNSLLVVGAGVLGTMVAQQWQKEFPSSKVYGKTRSTTRHAELANLGLIPCVDGDDISTALSDAGGSPFVLFCAPPLGNADYPGAVRAAAEAWNGDGAFLFTSSSAVFDVSDNGPCEERSAPILPLGKSPRADILLNAEKAALEAGGNVVRLAGLYTRERGAHTYWMKLGTVDARPDHYLNLIHYEDAASLCVAILKAKARGEIFVGCDDQPVTRQDVMDVAVRSGKFEGEFKGFTSTAGPLGKQMSNNWTRERLAWAPKYRTFEAFVSQC